MLVRVATVPTYLLVVLAMILSSSACAVEDAGDPGGIKPSIDEIGNIDPNNLLTDDDLEGHQDVTVVQVQHLLSSYGSALARYSENGLSAASLIVQYSTESHISPIYILARIQTESSLIESGSYDHISSATGCGCPDGAGCDPSISGFARQVQCSARTMRRYLTSLATSGVTVSGWRVGRAKSTSDPCTVTPANAATACLYTYTPWVGAYAVGCGDRRWGGSSLVALLYRRYAQMFPSSGGSSSSTCLGATARCSGGGCCSGLSCGTTTLGQVCCGNEGASCATANGEDCCGSLECVSGHCRAPGGATSCLPARAPCSGGGCCSGLSCGTTTLGQVCCGNEGATCATANGEDCCGNLECVGGHCTAPGGSCLPARSPCSGGGCCSGLSCGTTTLGQVCCGNEGATCATANGEDCCGNLECVGGHCTAPGGSCLPARSPCSGGGCCSGLSCGTTTLGQVCCGNEGATCATANGEDCCGNLECVGGHCTAPGSTADPCAASHDCASCTANASCGWCNGACHTGNSTGATVGNCGGATWAWYSSQCSSGGDPCGTSTDCASCTARASCGWCNGACRTGTSGGPSSSSCGGTPWAWVSTSCR